MRIKPLKFAEKRMLILWRGEDFALEHQRPPPIHDPWEPIAGGSVRADSEKRVTLDLWEPVSSSAAGDFWDPLGTRSSRIPPVTKDGTPPWFDDVSLPHFEPGASENPFWTKPQATPAERLIERRARWLLSLVDLTSQAERRRYIRQFEELFDHYQHQSTFRALTDLVLDGTSAQEIVAAFHLKLHWTASPKLWSVRPARLRTTIIPHHGEQLLGWTRAVRLVELSKGLPAEMIIDEDWYSDWLSLPFGDPGYWSFLDYANWRLEAFAAGALDLPRELRRIEAHPVGLEALANHSIDGVALGSPSRSGHLLRLATDAWNYTVVNLKRNEIGSAGSV